MIHEVVDFVKKFYDEHGPFKDILDVGSRNVNGNVAEIIDRKDVVGIDIIEGLGVTKVLNGHDISKEWSKPTFDLVTCTETLEHDELFWVTVGGMRNVVKPGGWMLITVPGINCPKHNWPGDYYRFFGTSLKDVFFNGFEDVHISELCFNPGGDNQYYIDFTDGHVFYPSNNDRPDAIMGYGRRP